MRSRCPVQAEGAHWDASEVWSVESRPELRLIEIEGAAAVDPAQTEMPEEWKQLPAYRVEPGGGLRLVEKRRGNEGGAADRLTARAHLASRLRRRRRHGRRPRRGRAARGDPARDGCGHDARSRERERQRPAGDAPGRRDTARCRGAARAALARGRQPRRRRRAPAPRRGLGPRLRRARRHGSSSRPAGACSTPRASIAPRRPGSRAGRCSISSW